MILVTVVCLAQQYNLMPRHALQQCPAFQRGEIPAICQTPLSGLTAGSHLG
jgi:hypothetical protein